jgi:hypothetical protein
MKIGKNIRKTHKSVDDIRRRTDKLSAEKSRLIAACGSTLLKMYIQNYKTFLSVQNGYLKRKFKRTKQTKT